jgi:uncharacterized phiE125 gp8 family phage protein
MTGTQRQPTAELYHSLSLVAGPTSEPVSVTEAKLHARVDPNQQEEDDLFAELITAARELCESRLGQSFARQTWTLFMDRFPGWEIELPKAPLLSVTSIIYVDSDGVTQTISPSLYLVDAAGNRPGRVTPIWTGYWPAIRYQLNAVQVTFVAGRAAVPASVKLAIKLLTSHWYESREAIVEGSRTVLLPLAVDALLAGQWTGTY